MVASSKIVVKGFRRSQFEIPQIGGTKIQAKEVKELSLLDFTLILSYNRKAGFFL